VGPRLNATTRWKDDKKAKPHQVKEMVCKAVAERGYLGGGGGRTPGKVVTKEGGAISERRLRSDREDGLDLLTLTFQTEGGALQL